jgi:KDO2-lipid IV(A) lauroyltransferase
MRSHFGTQSVGRGTPGAARQLLRILRESEALALLVDQDIEAEGCWVPFFGRLAHTPLGPAHLALRRRAVVIPTFDERLPSGRHRVTFHPPLELDPDPVRATAQMSLVIEEQIRRRPEQWVWMHRRWRRRPPEETDA